MSRNQPAIPRRTVVIDRDGNMLNEPAQHSGQSGNSANQTHNPGAHPENSGAENPGYFPPTYVRPWKEEILLRAATATGSALAWPLRLLAILAEQLVRSFASLAKFLLLLLLIPSLALFVVKFVTAQNDATPRSVGRNAAIAVTQTIAGIADGIRAAVSTLTSSDPAADVETQTAPASRPAQHGSGARG